jgi:copper chaperone
MKKAILAILAFLLVVSLLQAAEMKTANFKIEGMTCNGCVNKVKTSLSKVDGVKEAVVTLADNSAKVVYDPGKTNEGALKEVVSKAGYKVVANAEKPAGCAGCPEAGKAGGCCPGKK